jgi:hypothetical protein
MQRYWNGMGRGKLTSQLSRDHAREGITALRYAVDGDKYAGWRENGIFFGLRRGGTSRQIIERDESVHDEMMMTIRSISDMGVIEEGFRFLVSEV